MAQLLSLFTPSGRVTLLPFQCSTWTLDPASIPTCKELWIVEPPSVADDASLPLGKRTLVYPVDILYSVSFFFANYIQFQFTVLSHLLLIPTHRMGWTLEKAPAGPLWVSPSLPFSIIDATHKFPREGRSRVFFEAAEVSDTSLEKDSALLMAKVKRHERRLDEDNSKDDLTSVAL
jgi:hypothetical protein